MRVYAPRGEDIGITDNALSYVLSRIFNGKGLNKPLQLALSFRTFSLTTNIGVSPSSMNHRIIDSNLITHWIHNHRSSPLIVPPLPSESISLNFRNPFIFNIAVNKVIPFTQHQRNVLVYNENDIGKDTINKDDIEVSAYLDCHCLWGDINKRGRTIKPFKSIRLDLSCSCGNDDEQDLKDSSMVIETRKATEKWNFNACSKLEKDVNIADANQYEFTSPCSSLTSKAHDGADNQYLKSRDQNVTIIIGVGKEFEVPVILTI